MPLYEYECPRHGLFEVLKSFAEKREFEDCPVVEICEGEEFSCMEMCKSVVSVPFMQPDNMWSGVQTQIGNFTSRSEMRRVMQQKGIANFESGMEKDFARQKQSREEKIAKRRHEVCVEALKEY